MTAANFPAFLAFVWQPGFDSPDDGYHVTGGDLGGGTFGGVTEATWRGCVASGLVSGELRDATRDALQAVLRAVPWGSACDGLPAGLDVLVGNGRMMTGAYAHLVQQCLGFTGDDVDGDIGPVTLAAANTTHAPTLIRALTGVHEAYLMRVPGWAEFRGGWHRRLIAARDVALDTANARG